MKPNYFLFSFYEVVYIRWYFAFFACICEVQCITFELFAHKFYRWRKARITELPSVLLSLICQFSDRETRIQNCKFAMRFRWRGDGWSSSSFNKYCAYSYPVFWIKILEYLVSNWWTICATTYLRDLVVSIVFELVISNCSAPTLNPSLCRIWNDTATEKDNNLD